MATNYPYFKFTSSAWLTGDIVFEDMATQGAFINICAIYWERDGILTLSEIEKRFSRLIEKTELNRILANLTDRFLNITDSETGKFSIEFLDEQLQSIQVISERNSKNGAQGGRPKKLKDSEEKPKESEKNPPLSDLNPEKADKIREDKIREDKRREEGYFKKSISDQIWKESVMRACKIVNPEIWINQFNDHSLATEEVHDTVTRWRSHCVNWIKKELSKTPEPPKPSRTRRDATYD